MVDSIKKVRFELRHTADEYATSINEAIKDAARMYEMSEIRPRVTIQYPQTGVERIDADQQQRIVELHKEFHEFVRKHQLDTNYYEGKYDKDSSAKK